MSTKSSFLKVVKYQAVHSERMATMIEADTRLAKKALENLCLPPIEQRKYALIGFIQEISYDPFGVLMFSDIQVCLMSLNY